MSDESGDVPPGVSAGSRRDGGWDLRVVFVERRGRWWWNAWRAATCTELFGFADTPTEAWSAMHAAIIAAPVPDQVGERRARRHSGAA